MQESLGFSPFELVFGHTPRGPLKLLKERWLSDEEPESVLTRMSDIRHRLRKANELAQKNLKAAQAGMKTWYDTWRSSTCTVTNSQPSPTSSLLWTFYYC